MMIIKKKSVIEKDTTRKPLLTLSYDGTWVTHRYHVLVSVGIFIGSYSGLPLQCLTRTKMCWSCLLFQNKGFIGSIKNHNCTNNWNKSSGAMEGDMAVESVLDLVETSNIRLGSLVGDGDYKIDVLLQKKYYSCTLWSLVWCEN
jgi:hypothetical protein